MKITISKHNRFKYFIILLCFTILYNTASGQSNNNWYSFRDKKTDLIGYKDTQGKIKIPAIFGGFTGTLVFDNIIAAHNEKTGESYYLLKTGKKVGIDSLYTWDYTYDREKEGKIIFRDKITDKVGFFDKNGKIIIPALYNDAQSFYNGFAVVVYNGKRLCSDGSECNSVNPCEHWSWKGITALIDIHNKIIADSININQTSNINWYSFKIDKKQADTTLYTSFKSSDNNYYSFLDYKKEFNKWFFKTYLKDLRKNIPLNCYKEVVVEGKAGKNYTKASFLKKYQAVLTKSMKTVAMGKVKTSIFDEELNNYIETGKNFSKFYTRDGVPNKQKYPLFQVVSTYYKQKKHVDYQQQYSFLRTDNGYKLIAVALKVGLRD